MESVSVRHQDGTVDTRQCARIGAAVEAHRLEQLYWAEIGRVTRGWVRFSGGALRVFGRGPALLSFGPLAAGQREILGGWIARRPGGSIAWRVDGAEVTVAVEGFSPRLRGPLWRLESSFHDLIGRRFLRRLDRAVR